MWFYGGYAINFAMLPKVYVFHVLVAAIVITLAFYHMFLLHNTSSTTTNGVIGDSNVTMLLHVIVKDLVLLRVIEVVYLVFTLGLFNCLHPANNALISLNLGNNICNVNNLTIGDVSMVYHIVPEWYLLPFYAILRSIPDKLLGVVAMLSAIFILAALPWLDTSKVRSAVFRPLYKQFYWILVIDVLILGYVGAMPAEGLYLLIARVATAYYFLHFLLILPILGKIEKTTPLPLSITSPVLGGSADLAMAKNTDIRKEKL